MDKKFMKMSKSSQFFLCYSSKFKIEKMLREENLHINTRGVIEVPVTFENHIKIFKTGYTILLGKLNSNKNGPEYLTNLKVI